MTQKDESPNASEGPYWSEELLAVLVVGLGDETQARETLEGIIQQALSGPVELLSAVRPDRLSSATRQCGLSAASSAQRLRIHERPSPSDRP